MDHVKLTAPDGSAYITQRLFIYATCGGVAEESDSKYAIPSLA